MDWNPTAADSPSPVKYSPENERPFYLILVARFTRDTVDVHRFRTTDGACIAELQQDHCDDHRPIGPQLCHLFLAADKLTFEQRRKLVSAFGASLPIREVMEMG